LTEEKLKFFEGVKFEECEYSGRRVKFPFCFIDLSRMSASFSAPANKLKGALPTERLKPVEIKPGIAMVSFAGIEYREIDRLKPYNEFGVSMPVHYKRDENSQALPGLYVFYLPVTTEEARWGGVEFYGFPKFIAEISFEEAGEMRRCLLRAEGEDIITLEVKRLDTSLVYKDFYVYTVKEGQLLRTRVQTKGQSGTSSLPGDASYKLGNHHIAEGLQRLEIGGKAMQCSYSPKMQTILHKPGQQLPL
jgi:hypothetical protein